MQNLRQAIRLLRKTPGLSLLVVLILAAGIGANTSVLRWSTLPYCVVWPYRYASRLVSVAAIDRSGSTTSSCLSYPHFQLLGEHSRSFSSIAAFTNQTFSLSTGGEPIEYQAARASWNFFDLLGVKPASGRTFKADEVLWESTCWTRCGSEAVNASWPFSRNHAEPLSVCKPEHAEVTPIQSKNRFNPFTVG
ncbi:MAG: hypothetical protein JO033_29140 [Acidobacteriaceae bacterium]|nr:hypothetical protein [Acidobacteriaceae bacterium]